MEVKIAIGDIYDKCSILKLKSENFKQNRKSYGEQQHILTEYSYLSDYVQKLNKKDKTGMIYKLHSKLYNINKRLWEIEDNLRSYETQKIFDNDFIMLARNVYKTNDERYKIKKEINVLLNSEFIEEKIY